MDDVSVQSKSMGVEDRIGPSLTDLSEFIDSSLFRQTLRSHWTLSFMKNPIILLVVLYGLAPTPSQAAPISFYMEGGPTGYTTFGQTTTLPNGFESGVLGTYSIPLYTSSQAPNSVNGMIVHHPFCKFSRS